MYLHLRLDGRQRACEEPRADRLHGLVQMQSSRATPHAAANCSLSFDVSSKRSSRLCVLARPRCWSQKRRGETREPRATAEGDRLSDYRAPMSLPTTGERARTSNSMLAACVDHDRWGALRIHGGIGSALPIGRASAANHLAFAIERHALAAVRLRRAIAGL